MYQSSIHNYYIYILTNKNKTTLYTGLTNNLQRRLSEHINNAKIPNHKSFTARYNCTYLIYYERFDYIKEAIRREKVIKGWTRKKKIELINSSNPEWKFLNDEIMG